MRYIQHARFQKLCVDLHFGLFWSVGIPNMIGTTIRHTKGLTDINNFWRRGYALSHILNASCYAR